jgi:hypothetical protein
MKDFNIETQPEEVKEWFHTRPETVQKRILSHPPDRRYLLKDTNQVVRLYSYEEDDDGSCDTCQVLVLQEDNPHKLLIFERRVFGIEFDDLEAVSDDYSPVSCFDEADDEQA